MDLVHTLWSLYLVHIVDILIVAFIIYRVLLLVRGTRAVQIILGIVTLAVVTFLSTKVFHFRALSWLLGQFWLAAVVILIVVFQPEIRAALAQLGSHRWNRALFSLEDDCISELMDAIAECSRRQIGALIVVEQTVGLRTYIETGTLINAQVTKELLVSIFTPRTPLHDGAVIIQHDRVSAA